MISTVKLYRIGVPDRDGDIITAEALGKLPDSLPVIREFNLDALVGIATNIRIADGWLVADVEARPDGVEFAIGFERDGDRIELREVGQVPTGLAIQ